MKIIAIGVLIALFGAIAVILAMAAAKPNTFRVQRSIVINAKPEKIAAQITDFRKWTSWSPYEKKDPAMTRIYTGPKTGLGTVYEWKGNSSVGSGRMEITGISPSIISIKLDFFKPMEGHNIAEFILEPERRSTKVTWVMHGPTSFIGKIFHVFFNMDAMVGGDFETGLGRLKEIAER